MIVSAVGAAIAGLAAAGFGAPAYGVLLAGGLAFALSLGGILWSGSRSFRGYGPALTPIFPTPKPPTSAR